VTQFSDFWGFLQQCEARLNKEASEIQSDAEMKTLIARWLNPSSGVLEQMKDDPFLVLAKPSGRQIFIDTMRNRVQQVEQEWEEVRRSLYEPES
jgi:hypothetical protein